MKGLTHMKATFAFIDTNTGVRLPLDELNAIEIDMTQLVETEIRNDRYVDFIEGKLGQIILSAVRVIPDFNDMSIELIIHFAE